MTLINEATSILIPHDVVPSQITEKKIQSFKEFEPGWHYGEGVSFQQSIRLADKLESFSICNNGGSHRPLTIQDVID